MGYRSGHLLLIECSHVPGLAPVAVDTSDAPLTALVAGLDHCAPQLMKPNAEELASITGGDAEALDKHALSVLEYAAWRGHDRMIDLLLERVSPAHVAHSDQFGMTALFKAVGFSHHTCVRVLVERGAGAGAAVGMRGVGPRAGGLRR